MQNNKKEALFIFFAMLATAILLGWISYSAGYDDGINFSIEKQQKEKFKELVEAENRAWENEIIMEDAEVGLIIPFDWSTDCSCDQSEHSKSGACERIKLVCEMARKGVDTEIINSFLRY